MLTYLYLFTGVVQKSAGAVRGPAAGTSLPSSQQDQHWSRGAAAIPCQLLQGNFHTPVIIVVCFYLYPSCMTSWN